MTANHGANTASVLLGTCSGIAEAGVSCTSCSTNQYTTDHITCQNCAAGHYLNVNPGSSCTPCAAGYYNTGVGYGTSSSNATACTPCPFGTASTIVGANSSSVCLIITPTIETAIKDGDVEIVEKLVPFITDIDAKNRFLQVAVANCQSVIAGFFITSGADVNAKYPDEDFPLHKASRCKAANTTQVLLDAKAQIADVNAVNKKGNTALHIAARYGCKDVVEELLGHEANVHAKNKFGDTALHHAAHWDHKDIVEILLEHHARVEEPNHADQTALMLAIRGGTPDTMKPLVAAMTTSRSWQEEADFANIAGYGDIAQAIESNIAGGVKSDEL